MSKQIIETINNLLSTIDKSIIWATKYEQFSFPIVNFKHYRRELNKIKSSLEDNCSATAYGESQVGKSYLMNSLLSEDSNPFRVFDGVTEQSFINTVNPSGNTNTSKETTGLITRFTTKCDNELMYKKGFIKIRNFTLSDIILVLADSFYKDTKVTEPLEIMQYINQIEEEINSSSKCNQNYISEDDIDDIQEYLKNEIGSATQHINEDYFDFVRMSLEHMSIDNVVKIFGAIWNNNQDINRLFRTLIDAYHKIDFNSIVYIPFDVIKCDNANPEPTSLLDVRWLDKVLDTQIYSRYTTEVYDQKGNIICKDFPKTLLSAICSEIDIIVGQEYIKDRSFLKTMDLLDFPGARSREEFSQEKIGKDDVLPQMLRRGKVAYLFTKYSENKKINTVLWCHHNDQKTVPAVVNTITQWLKKYIGENAQMRSKHIAQTNYISPLFFIATKFNIDLKKLNESSGHLTHHWARFTTTIPEIVKGESWFDDFVEKDNYFKSAYFQSIYPLRDFFWSNDNGLFTGYSSQNKTPESQRVVYSDFPTYFDELQDDFIKQDFVKKHFKNPKQTWDECTSVGCDGSKAIIEDLNKISTVIQQARNQEYLSKIDKISKEIRSKLLLFYIDDKAGVDTLVKRIIGSINLDLGVNISKKFGKTIDNLMINSEKIRKTVFRVLRTEMGEDVNNINSIRANAGINPKDNKQINIKKMLEFSHMETKEDLLTYFDGRDEEHPLLDDIISGDIDALVTKADVIAKRIVDDWKLFLNERLSTNNLLTESGEICTRLQLIFDKLNIRYRLKQKISEYCRNDINTDNASLSTIIADHSAFVFNDFISNIGYNFLTQKDIESIKQKAKHLNIDIEFPVQEHSNNRQITDLMNTLLTIQESEKVLEQGVFTPDKQKLLRNLPLWDNFYKWKNMLAIGLIYVSDVQVFNVEANEQIKLLLGTI